MIELIIQICDPTLLHNHYEFIYLVIEALSEYFCQIEFYEVRGFNNIIHNVCVFNHSFLMMLKNIGFDSKFTMKMLRRYQIWLDRQYPNY